MRCIKPRPVGFQADGKTIAWSYKKASKEYPFFQLPCGKCIACRLEYGRTTAVRCVHESMVHQQNAFINLTYSDEHLKSPKLVYSDFQKLVMDIRYRRWQGMLNTLGYTRKDWQAVPNPEKKSLMAPFNIGVFVTGEYGDEKKRPHWHALIFNWRPLDLEKYYINDHGDQVYTSKSLDELWGKNCPKKRPNEIGDVTFHSAGYVARYAAKKLIHGHDQDHDYHPIHKRSSKHAIGKKWLEQHWQHVFAHGYCTVMAKDKVQKIGIPRYYEKWLHKNYPAEYVRYVTEVKSKFIHSAEARSFDEKQLENEINNLRLDLGKPLQITRLEREKIILESNFNRLQKSQNGD